MVRSSGRHDAAASAVRHAPATLVLTGQAWRARRNPATPSARPAPATGPGGLKSNGAADAEGGDPSPTSTGPLSGSGLQATTSAVSSTAAVTCRSLPALPAIA